MKPTLSLASDGAARTLAQPHPTDRHYGSAAGAQVDGTPEPLLDPWHGFKRGNEAEETKARNGHERQRKKQAARKVHSLSFPGEILSRCK
jgi:hypothetical protein